MDKGRKILCGWLAVVVLAASLHAPRVGLAEEPDIIEPPFDAIDVRASRFEKLLEGETTDSDEISYWVSFLLAAGLLTRTVPSVFSGVVETIKDAIALSKKNKQLEDAKKRAEVRHADRLAALQKAAEAYEQALKEAQTGERAKAKEAKVKQTGKKLAEAFNAIIEYENKHLSLNDQQGTLRYDADANSFHRNSPLGDRISFPEPNPQNFRKASLESCAVSYQQIAGDIDALKWKRLTNWAWPATYALGTVGATTWWRYVAEQRKEKNGGKSVLEIQSDKIKANSARLAKATDLAHQLENLDDPKWVEISADFSKIIMEVLQHNETRITDYFKKNVPAEIQEMLDIDQIIHDSLHGEHATAMLKNVLPKSMAAAAKATLGEATPQDVMGIIGTKDIAKQETDTKSFLIILYAEIFNRLWPKLAFKNTNGDSHMILVSPIISDSLSRMRGLKLKIQEQQKEKKPESNQAGSQPSAENSTAAAEATTPVNVATDSMASIVTKTAMEPIPGVLEMPTIPK
ncbi:MAG: cell envelope integrity protein TolA [Bdellovibrionales bacterium]|nr:cell envelope integrity protein TolA [Bdellovibrionales bacterium]